MSIFNGESRGCNGTFSNKDNKTTIFFRVVSPIKAKSKKVYGQHRPTDRQTADLISPHYHVR